MIIVDARFFYFRITSTNYHCPVVYQSGKESRTVVEYNYTTLKGKKMKNKINRLIIALLLMTVLFTISACGSKEATPVIVNTQQEVLTTPVSISPKNFDCASVTEVPASECQALVALYNTTNGNGWLNKSGWLENAALSTWYGVAIKAGHVDSLNVSKNQLAGSLPSDLGNLANLVYLDVSDNQLTGQIPMELGSLTNLRSLILSFNKLSGTIPSSLGNLSNLTSLYLSSNQLEGSVPAEIGNLVNLKSLHIYENQLSGSLPVSLINLVSLESFSFFGTSLCEPPTSDFQDWKSSITQWYGNGSVCQ